MGKGWSIFFGAVLLGTFLIWFAAPVFGWWLPENVSTFGGAVDGLFYMILGLTAVFFVLTEVVLVYAMWRFAYRPGEKAQYSHGNHRLEVVWTAIPAVLLLVIAFSQLGVWERIKYQSRMPAPDLTISVLARQWEWRMRYPDDTSRFKYTEEGGTIEEGAKKRAARAWAENAEIDDIHVPNEVHCWKGANVKLYLRTQDVLHSFTLPNLRLKQDTLPGKTIPMWFQANKHNCRFVPKMDKEGKPTGGDILAFGGKTDAWEIACQELCGGRHYAMRGRLYVHEDKASYDAWLAHTKRQQQTRTLDTGVALAP